MHMIIYVFLMDAVTTLTLTWRRLPSDELLKNQLVRVSISTFYVIYILGHN